MSGRFDAFVLLAGMRTGSNHLEATLSGLPGVTSHGEVFNPIFLGQHNRFELLGMDMAARDADPLELLRRLVDGAADLPGFRLFQGHDPRVLDAILPDPRIAKVVLGRNPLDAYVSFKIAQATGQWKLTNPKMAKSAKAPFDGAEFDEMTAAERAFRDSIRRGLQVTGQTAFWIDYSEINDREVLSGLAAFLGVEATVEDAGGKLKRQNPGTVEDKVEDPDAMRAHLARQDPFGLDRAPEAGPVPGPAVPSMMAASATPVLVLPVPGGPTAALRDWLTRLDGTEPQEGMNQRDLRRWARQNKGFVSLAVVSHPLERAHRVFCDHVLAGRPKALRQILSRHYGATFPDAPDDQAHRADFAAFLRFAKANLGGQTALPVDPLWGSQLAALQGMAQVILPTRILREGEVAEVLAGLVPGAPSWTAPPEDRPHALATIHDRDLEDWAMEVWRRDYLTFGFRRWGR